MNIKLKEKHPLLAMFITYFLSLFPILQIAYLSTCAHSATITPITSEFDLCRNFPTCNDINCTLGLYCETLSGDCTVKLPCCPEPFCYYDPCERSVCQINFCSNEPGKVCALRQQTICFVPPCCPDPVCEDPIQCSQSDCDIRCNGTEKLALPSKFIECNTGCACD